MITLFICNILRDYCMTFSISALVLARNSHIKPDSKAGGFHTNINVLDRFYKYFLSHCTDRHCLVYIWKQIRNKNICKLNKGNSLKDLFSQFVSSRLSSSVVHRKLSHLNLLLWNSWTKLNLTWQGWSLGRSLSKLCATTTAAAT
jgi:hypothetical protein